MRSIPHLAAALAATLLACSGAHALEAFKTYDTFSAAPLNPALWADGERVRLIKGGTLNLMQRNWGLTTTDSDVLPISFAEHLTNPATVTELKAKITVNALEVHACPTNPSVGQSRARIFGTFFNIGSPVPGSEVGDVLAQVKLTRFSNSTDPVGVLRVQGSVVICTSADCSSSTNIGSVADLGTVTLGQAATVQLQWNKAGNKFQFSRDGGAFVGSVAYTQTDASPPGVALAELSTKMEIPSCTTGPRLSGMVDAIFDNVAVNASAVP